MPSKRNIRIHDKVAYGYFANEHMATLTMSIWLLEKVSLHNLRTLQYPSCARTYKTASSLWKSYRPITG